MALQSLTYAQIGAGLGISPEAARKKVRALMLPSHVGNDGKARTLIDLEDLRDGRNRRSADGPPPSNPVHEMQAQIEVLRSDLNAAVARAAVLEAQLSGLSDLVATERARGDEARADRDRWHQAANRPWWRRLAV